MRWALRFILVLIALDSGAEAARSDGGLLRLTEQAGPYRLSVFTTPTPLRAGPIDVSVLVQDAGTGATRSDVTVTITLTPAAGDGSVLHARATSTAATNKLFQAAAFDLPDAGPWLVTVALNGPEGTGQAAVTVEAEPSPPRWVELWAWIAWPLLPIALFARHQVRAWRRSSAPPAGTYNTTSP